MHIFDRKSLPVQLVLSLVGLALLTALIAGLPAIWLIRRQVESQEWAQVDQAVQATQALYSARENEVKTLATLTAQRPSLRSLLRRDDPEALAAYLEILRQGADLDWIAVCDSRDALVAQVTDLSNGAPQSGQCSLSQAQLVTTISSSDESLHIFFAAPEPIETDHAQVIGRVVVGRELDAAFAEQIRSQTGLEHTLFVNDRPVATSLPGGTATARETGPAPARGRQEIAFVVSGKPYFAKRMILQAAEANAPSIGAEVALDVATLASAEQRLVRVLLASIALASAVGFVLAVFLAQRISQPLGELASTAIAMSRGDLARPVIINSKIREVALVGEALNGARVDLNRTLDELRREKAWTDHLLSAIVEGIVTLDRQGYITYFSHGAERITGLGGAEAVGQNCDQVFTTVNSDRAFSALIPAPGGRSKISLKLADGRQAILAITGARLLPAEGGDARVALVFRDITEEEAVHRLLGHFLANVSHEFRTPLSAVAAAVELLVDQVADLTVDEIQELLTSLHLGVLNLQKLVDNLLESANIEAGRFQVRPRPCNLEEIIAEAVRTMQPLLDKHGQRLTIELPASIPAVQADHRRAIQVVVNLLSNASKYGPINAEVVIGVTATPSWVRLTVSDQGPGIAAARRVDLFERFAVTEGASNGGLAGFGLGLSVVKAIVEGHHGQVGVDDRPGGGSVFWFTLPVAEGI